MKKYFVGVAALAMMLGAISCEQSVGRSSTLKTDADSAAYALGLMQGERATTNPYTGEKLDSVLFIKGLEAGFQAAKVDTTGAYAQGMQMGVQLGDVFRKEGMDPAIFMAAFEAAVKADSASFKFPSAEAQDVLNSFGQKIQEREQRKQEEQQRKQAEENDVKGKEYISNFSKEEGVQTTESGLAYKVLKPGTGVKPTAESTVKVNYVGTHIDGTEFDKGEGTEFSLGSVIKGWTEMLQLMQVGEKVKVAIPYQLAYGEQGTYNIAPGSTLVFEIELLEVKK